MEAASTNVKVAVRVRPQLARERIEACRICTYVSDDSPQITLGKDKAFTFDYLFDIPTNQKFIYDSCVKDLVEGCFKGYNATVLAYGQTGSGKTYTMGTSFETGNEVEVGVIPRALHHLFNGIEQRKQCDGEHKSVSSDFEVSVQFMELYNEDVIDLFDTARSADSKSKIRIHEDAHGNIVTTGMTSRSVCSPDEALKLLHDGALNRTTASTQMNSQSSRSHAIFSVHIKQTKMVSLNKEMQGNALGTGEKMPEDELETLSAKLHFTDLAGSERLKRTGATGDRLKEGVSINSGLLALGNVISALGDTSKKVTHVPYRDSKLTRILQDSLGGNSQTLMIACISPSDRDFMETLSTLKYANRARNIKNKVVVNQDSSSKQIRSLRQQIDSLQLELTEYKTGKKAAGGEADDYNNDLQNENKMLLADNRSLRSKMKALQETVNVLNDEIVSLKTKQACSEINDSGAGGDSNGSGSAVESMIGHYIKEIESLRSKLIESEAACSSLRTKQHSAPFYGLGSDFKDSPRAVTPLNDLIRTARSDIARLEERKNMLQQKAALHNDSQEEKEPGENPDEHPGEDDSEILDDEEDVSLSSPSPELDDESLAINISQLMIEQSDDEIEKENETPVHEDLAILTSEMDMKQQLVNSLEILQNRITNIQSQYEDKLQVMSDRIKVTEKERDDVLKNLDMKKEADKNEANKVHQKYAKKLESLKEEVKQLNIAKKKHDKLMREQAKNLNQLNQMKRDLDMMKKAKVKLMRQMKEDQKKNRSYSQKWTKEMMNIKREMKSRVVEIRRLESQNRKKDQLVYTAKREVEILKRKAKPVSSKRPISSHSSYAKTVKKTNSRTNLSESKPAVNSKLKREDKASKLVDLKNARTKWVAIEKKIRQIVTHKETIQSVEKQMERSIAHREQLRTAIKNLSDENADDFSQGQHDRESLTDNINFINEQIQQFQMEIMQLEESTQGHEELIKMVGICSINEARHILDQLLVTIIHKSVAEIQLKSALKDLENQLLECQETNKGAENLIQCLLHDQEKESSRKHITSAEGDKHSNDSSNSTVTSRESSPIDGIGITEANLEPKDVLKSRVRNFALPHLLHGNKRIPKDVISDGSDERNDSTVGKPSAYPVLPDLSNAAANQLDADNSYSTDSNPSSAASTPSGSEKGLLSRSRPTSPISGSTSNVFSRLMIKPSSPQTNVRKGRFLPCIDTKINLASSAVVCNYIAEGHRKAVLSVQANENLMFSGSKDRSVKVWNLVTGQEILSLGGHPNNVNVVQHCPNTGLVYSVSLCYIKVWDIRSHAKCVRVLNSTGSANIPASIGTTRTMQRTNEMPDSELQISDLKITPDSKYLLCGTGTHVAVWDLDKFAIINKLTGHTGNIMTIAVSDAHNRSVITGSKDHYIKVYDLSKDMQKTVSPVTTLSPPHMDGVESFAYLSSEDVLFSASRDKAIKKWDLSSRTAIKSEYPAHSNWVCALDVLKQTPNKSGNMLASGGRNGIIKFWDTDDLTSLGEFKAHGSTINCIASNSSHMFTASSDNTIKMWSYNKES